MVYLNMATENSDEILIETEDFDNEEETTTTVEELLISCVMVRPPLWDSRLPIKERSKTIRDYLWIEIYDEFGRNPEYPVEFLIKKWRNLRDTYVRLKGEYTPSGSAAKKKRKWEFFDIMSFLNDTISYRHTVTNVASISTDASSSPVAFPVPLVSGVVSGEQKTSTRRKLVDTPVQKVEAAIIETLTKINAVPIETSTGNAMNPICVRISEILDQMPNNSRTALEIKLLQVAYEGAKEFL